MIRNSRFGINIDSQRNFWNKVNSNTTVHSADNHSPAECTTLSPSETASIIDRAGTDASVRSIMTYLNHPITTQHCFRCLVTISIVNIRGKQYNICEGTTAPATVDNHPSIVIGKRKSSQAKNSHCYRSLTAHMNLSIKLHHFNNQPRSIYIAASSYNSFIQVWS